MTLRSALINVMDRAARKAARGLVRDFGEVENLQVSKKGPSDFVSAADIKAERVLKAELARARPGFGFLLEEAGGVAGADTGHRWIVDPLDGTTNFLHGLAHFAISIALEENGEVVAGLVHDPIQDHMYWAEKGRGAYLNDRRLRVSSRRDMGSAVIATGIPFKGRGDHPRYLRTLAAVMAEVAGIRRFGTASLDLAFVAAGRFDGFWEFGLKPWDIAAGLLLVREAGGRVGEIGGGAAPLESGDVLAGNEDIFERLGGLVRGALDAGGQAA